MEPSEVMSTARSRDARYIGIENTAVL